MLFADSTVVSGSTCFTLSLILAIIGWVLNKRAKKRKAEAQR